MFRKITLKIPVAKLRDSDSRDASLTAPNYGNLKRHFDVLETQFTLLHDDCMEFINAIESLFTTQLAFTEAMTELYRPMIHKSSDLAIFESERHFYGDKMCRQFQGFILDLRQEIQPELHLIESRVLKPIERLLDLIFDIHKVMIERDRRALEQAKLRAALHRINKESKSLNNTKETEKLLSSLASEFDYCNSLLITDLPRFFRLQKALIDPLFQTFYYLQLYVYYTLTQNMTACRIGHLDLEGDIPKVHHLRQGDAQAQLDKLSLTKTKSKMALLNRSVSFILSRRSSGDRESIASTHRSAKSTRNILGILNPVKRVKSLRKSARMGKFTVTRG